MNEVLVARFPEIVQFTVTFLFFLLESMLHYHVGKFGTIGLAFPKPKELILIIITIITIAGASTLTTRYINDNFLAEYNKKIKEKDMIKE